MNRKAEREALPPTAKKLLDAVLMEFAERTGVTKAMTDSHALGAMHDLLDAGLIRIEGNGEELRLVIPGLEVRH